MAINLRLDVRVAKRLIKFRFYNCRGGHYYYEPFIGPDWVLPRYDEFLKLQLAIVNGERVIE